MGRTGQSAALSRRMEAGTLKHTHEWQQLRSTQQCQVDTLDETFGGYQKGIMPWYQSFTKRRIGSTTT